MGLIRFNMGIMEMKAFRLNKYTKIAVKLWIAGDNIIYLLFCFLVYSAIY